jgi:uncharacterized membrane protein YfcA
MVLLALVVAVGFTVEAAVGFGATLLPVAIGSLFMPTTEVLFHVVPLNIVLSASIAYRARRAIDLRALLKRILPTMLLGFPFGLYAVQVLSPRQIQWVLAGFVLVLATFELVSMARPARVDAPPRRLSVTATLSLLFLGGVAHGALATGGPPVVYVCARTLPDKATFRATLTALWLLMNLALIVVYVSRGEVSMPTLRESGPLVPALFCGIGGGDLLHGRVPERAFRAVVFALLLVVAVVLGVRA